MRLPNVVVALILFLVSPFVFTAAHANPAHAAPTDAAQVMSPTAPIGTGFTYQASLERGEELVNEVCDFQFALFDSLSAGNQLGSAETFQNVQVEEGRFTVTLNETDAFGNTAFNGEARWLGISLRCPAGMGNFSALTPRQPVLPAPYAYYALNAPWSGLTGVPAGLLDGVDNDHNHLGQTWITGTTPVGLHIELSNPATTTTALKGQVAQGTGVRGVATEAGGTGVSGNATSTSGSGVGVLGETRSVMGYGIAGINSGTTFNSIGIYGKTGSPDGYAGYFEGAGYFGGNVRVTGSLNTASFVAGAGTVLGDLNIGGALSAPGKNFRIDHPLDPENRYLVHSSVESDEMLNLYTGNATLDANGQAWVTLPDWFGALNTDFRYQLTAIGAPGPNLYIAQPVQDNRFLIAGGTNGQIVSWQVTGVRQDTYALTHPLVVEQDKPAPTPAAESPDAESPAAGQ